MDSLGSFSLENSSLELSSLETFSLETFDSSEAIFVDLTKLISDLVL
jgi:hypothetical protein